MVCFVQTCYVRPKLSYFSSHTHRAQCIPDQRFSFPDIDTSLNDQQLAQLSNIALQQLMPATPPAQPVPQSRPMTPAPLPDQTPMTPTLTVAPAVQPSFFPLVKLYDYLHLFCLNMQLEVFYLQSTVLARTRWADQLKCEMNTQRTTLRLGFWGKGGGVAGWAAGGDLATLSKRASSSASSSTATATGFPSSSAVPFGSPGNYIEISIVEDEEKSSRSHFGNELGALGAEVGSLMDDRVLGYPKCWLRVRWVGVKNGVSDGYGLIVSNTDLLRSFIFLT